MFYTDIDQQVYIDHNYRTFICKEDHTPVAMTKPFIHSNLVKYFGISDSFAEEVIKEQLPIGRLLSVKE